MDTNYFIYDVRLIHFYADIRCYINQHFDSSEHEKDNVFYFSFLNKKALG